MLALREIAAGKVTPDILDQPVQEPDDDIDPSDVAAFHQQAAEMVVEDVSAANDDDEDFDEDFDVSEDEETGEDTKLSADAKPSDEKGAEAEEAPDASSPDEEPEKGA